MKRILGSCIASVVLITITGCAGSGQGRTHPSDVSAVPPPPRAQVSLTDEAFVQEAAQGAVAEIQLADLAQQQSSSPAVQQYARRIQSDHIQSNQQLTQIAQDADLKLPSTPPPEHREALQELSQLSGSAFDREFIDAQIEDHRKDIALFRNEAENGQDPALKGYAANVLPTLESHLEMAQSLANQMGAAS